MKKYKTIVADPPWEVGRGPPWNSNLASRPLTYPTMTLEQIKKLNVKDYADDGCVLYLWTINKYLEHAYDVARSWGFKPSTVLVWCKNPHGIGLGGTYCLTTEYCLFATRGGVNQKMRIDTTWFNYKRGRHSEKPSEFMELFEKVSNAPYLELFSRVKRLNWDVWGNEVESDIQLNIQGGTQSEA